MPQLLPHGAYSVAPAVLATCAWVSSLFQDGCDYATLRGDIVQSYAASAPYLEIGFDAYREPWYNPDTGAWQVSYASQCLDYPETTAVDIDDDTFWKVAKFLDFVADVLGGAGAFFLWFATCCVFSPGTWRWTGYEVGLAAICQSLNFLWFRNQLCQEGECSLSWGAKLDIVAASLWATAAVLVLAHYPHADWQDDEDSDDGSYYEDEECEDGDFEEVDLPPNSPGYSDHHDALTMGENAPAQVSGEASYEDEPRGMHAKIV